MQRMTSPLVDDRSTKRSRVSLDPKDMDDIPENVVDIVNDGDTVLVLSGLSSEPERRVGLRVSQYALCMASPVFKATFANESNSLIKDSETKAIVSLSEDDGDAMLVLCNILHLRNDRLPARILPDTLCKIATLAQKYQCVIAASRATVQWFDQLYSARSPGNMWKVIEAAYLLDEAMYFARFTSRWVLEQSIRGSVVPVATTTEMQKLGFVLRDQHMHSVIAVRNNLDSLVDCCAFAFSKQCKHYIDWAPGMSPDADETPTNQQPTECRVDPEGAMLYVGALRDAQIWPSTTWEKSKAPNDVGATIGDLVTKLVFFREPEYDDADKCEFCEGIKVKFTEQLDTVKQDHKERLWGMCLDCYNAGSVFEGECRYEHVKANKIGTNGLGIQGV